MNPSTSVSYAIMPPTPSTSGSAPCGRLGVTLHEFLDVALVEAPCIEPGPPPGGGPPETLQRSRIVATNRIRTEVVELGHDTDSRACTDSTVSCKGGHEALVVETVVQQVTPADGSTGRAP